MKRRYLIPLATVGAVAYGGVADAHTPDVSDNCNGLQVVLTQYEGGGSNNRVTVNIDGGTQTFDFGSSLTKSFSWAPTAAHSWTVNIDANRNSGHPTEWDRTFNGTEQPCQTPSTTTTTVSTTSTTTPPSTTATPDPTTTSTAPTTSSSPSTTSPPTSTTTSTVVAVGEPPAPTTTNSIPPIAPPASVAAEPPTALPATGTTVNLWLPVVLVAVGTFCWLATRRRTT